MRIISGKARGTKISTIENDKTRPTLDRVRESLFNIIQYEIKDTNVLDLFAGSGALGIEALSRGASEAIFCDINLDCIKIIRQNLEKTHLEDKAKLFNTNYSQCLKKLSDSNIKFDIVFIDPPYKENIAIDATKNIIRLNLLNENGIIIIETDEVSRDEKGIDDLIKSGDKQFQNLHIISKRKYGRANLLFLSINEEK